MADDDAKKRWVVTIETPDLVHELDARHEFTREEMKTKTEALVDSVLEGGMVLVETVNGFFVVPASRVQYVSIESEESSS